MGNIESWMTYAYLTSYLNSIQIFPQRITLKNPSNKRGCAFLEFLSREKAEEIMNNYNGKTINNFELKFNWVKTSEEKLLSSQGKKYKVKINFIYNIIYI
jgi:RNA recognition motif-containing protein